MSLCEYYHFVGRGRRPRRPETMVQKIKTVVKNIFTNFFYFTRFITGRRGAEPYQLKGKIIYSRMIELNVLVKVN